MDDRASHPGFITAAAFVVAALGVMGALHSYQVSAGYSGQYPDAYGGERAQVRFAPLIAQVPPKAVLGYLTDLAGSDKRAEPAFLSAQYALAPRVIVSLNGQAQPEWAVGNFSKPVDFAAAGSARGYAMVSDLGNGVVLYRRKGS